MTDNDKTNANKKKEIDFDLLEKLISSNTKDLIELNKYEKVLKKELDAEISKTKIYRIK